MAWANAAADSPRTRGARAPFALRRPTARVALGVVRPRARSWCAPYPPARGLGARERRARGDGRDERPWRARHTPARVERGWSGTVWHVRSDRHEEKRQEEEKTNTARERPCSTAAARATRGVRARRARRARVVCRSVRRSLASLEAATTEKTRDKDDDRRQRTGEDHHSYEPEPEQLRT